VCFFFVVSCIRKILGKHFVLHTETEHNPQTNKNTHHSHSQFSNNEILKRKCVQINNNACKERESFLHSPTKQQTQEPQLI